MSQYQRLSVAEATQLLQTESVAIVDVRDEQAYQAGHIEGALQLDNGSLPEFLEGTPQQTPVLVYCYHGHSSQSVAAYLVDQGYLRVYSMDGGYEAWRQTI